MRSNATTDRLRQGNPAEVFVAFLQLGLIAFGGPVAHLSYFRNTFVARRCWLTEADYAQTVALCQMLPGPASSQVGIVLGYRRAGLLGGLAAWCGFTLPSALILIGFAYCTQKLPAAMLSGTIHGLLVASVAIVANAVLAMSRILTPDTPRRVLALLTAIGALLLPATGQAQLFLIALGAVYGWLFQTAALTTAPVVSPNRSNIRIGIYCGALFLILLIGLPLADQMLPNSGFTLFTKFFEVGSLVFGGGHVVLPLLQTQVVTPGWISEPAFIAGYGAAQAVPGPLFTFAAYLGFAMEKAPIHGLAGAVTALTAIFLPSFLMLAAVLPFWQQLQRQVGVAAALRGVNAAVVGILLAALYQPVWVNAIHGLRDVVLLLVATVLLGVWKWPSWAVVLSVALVGTVAGAHG